MNTSALLSKLTAGLDVFSDSSGEPDDSKHWARKAILEHKRESVQLAFKARKFAVAACAILLLVMNPTLPVLYYECLLGLCLLFGWIHTRLNENGSVRPELMLLVGDLILMTIAILVPNPFHETDWPVAMRYRSENFIFYFVLLAVATLLYSWRTILAMAGLVVVLWTFGLIVISTLTAGNPELSAAISNALASDPRLARILDPSNVQFNTRLQEMVLFVVVAVILAAGVQRSQTLLMSHTKLERERANLARYFSPNMVEELSHNDEPLRHVRSLDVAVLFVDIVGFTRFAAANSPEHVIETLREFHARMEKEVFRNSGTLDKYMGDGLMVTFGTPITTPVDALSAISCARSMMESIDAWNRERESAGLSTIRASFGLHYGPVVLGDIGVQRMEFAAIGNTVNVASRLEAMTRRLDAVLVASDAFVDHARRQASNNIELLRELTRLPEQEIEGLSEPLPLWMIARDGGAEVPRSPKPN